MKKIFWAMIVFFSIFPTVNARADLKSAYIQDDDISNEKMILENIDMIDLSGWDELLKEINELDSTPMGREINANELIKDIALGREKIASDKILADIKSLILGEIRYNYKLLIELLVIAILCGIINSLTDSFENTSVGRIGYFACYITVVVIIFKNLLYVLDIGRKVIDNMVRFMHIVFPSLLALILATGGVTTSSVLQPAFVLVVNFVGPFLKNTMLPLIFLSAIISIISYIGDGARLTKLNGLIKSICSWILGITFTILIGVMMIQGIMSTTFDGISIRTTKYAIENFVPVVGGLFSQTVDTIIGCSVIVKNAVGVAGLFIIAMLCLIPCIKIFAILVIYKITSALIELISDERIANCLADMASVLSILLLTVLGIALVFFLTISIMIAAGNVIFFMR